MEVLDKQLLASLKTMSWNQTLKEINKVSETLLTVLEMLGQGKNVQPYISAVIENCLVTGAARNIRKLAYVITRQAATLYELPWSTVTSSVSQDLGTASDPEFQVYALRMLYILPLEDAISTFLAQETVIMAGIQGKNNEFTQVGFLSSISGVLIRIWCGLGYENFQLQDAIKETFKYILSLLTDSDDKLCCLAFSALGSLFHESEEGKLRGLSQELEANGSDSELLSPLISYLCQPHCSNLALIIYRVNSIDFRMRVKLIYPLTKLVIWSQNESECLRLEHECLVPVLYNLEKGVIWEVSNCLNLLKAEISTISLMCSSLLDQAPTEPNPTSLLLLVMQGMTSLPVSSQLNLALETLKNSNRIQAKVDRFSVLLSCLNSLVVLSKILLQNNEQSAIYQLFSQTWFVEMWMNSKPSVFREEVLCCLVEACLDGRESTENWLIVALEVIDICFKVLDWPCDENGTVGYTYFFLLFEEVCVAPKDSALLDRVQQSIENLINRLSLDSNTIKNNYALHLSVLICSKYWLPQDEQALLNFMELLRIKLFSAEHLSIVPGLSQQCLQFLLCSCFYLAKRFSTQSFDAMYRNLEELHEVYEQGDREGGQITKILEILKIYGQNPELIENEYQGYYSMLIERIPIVYNEETENFYDSMHAALNIFNNKRNECFNSERPLELLRIVQPVKELNWRCLRKTEVTGICDPLRAFCTHVIYPQ